MTIPLTATAIDFQKSVSEALQREDVRAYSARILDETGAILPPYFADLVDMGCMGLPAVTADGGDSEHDFALLGVLEVLGRAVGPGAVLSTMLAAAILSRVAPDEWEVRAAAISNGELRVGFGFRADVVDTSGRWSGDAGAVIGGAVSDLHLLLRGDDLLIIDGRGDGVTSAPEPGHDPGMNAASLTLANCAEEVVTLIPGAGNTALAWARMFLAAEAVGGARECLDSALSYAKTRKQFGREIGSFQAVKHHLADMLVEAELATAAVWDAGRAISEGGEQFEMAAAAALEVAAGAYLGNARTNIQIHGGIGYTWEHSAHQFLRRALTISRIEPSGAAAESVGRLRLSGGARQANLTLPPEVEALRPEIRGELDQVASLPLEDRPRMLVEKRLVLAQLPEPWGRGATPGEQLLISSEFDAHGIELPTYGITGWVLATILQVGSPEQEQRWVPSALERRERWCQLFSEPDAGSDAAAARTRGERVEGGWLVTGQKVWTSGAHLSKWGLATVRTDPSASKHLGLTMMAIDLESPGVEVRPIRQINGDADFNEVFMDQVFVPDSDVVGQEGEGWKVARATLANERLTIGEGNAGGFDIDGALVEAFDRAERPDASLRRFGALHARGHAIRMVAVRRNMRAIAGGPPGPEGNITKLARARLFSATSDLVLELGWRGPFAAVGSAAHGDLLMALRAPLYSIAGGTSEITKNVIAERILGLPREPLMS